MLPHHTQADYVLSPYLRLRLPGGLSSHEQDTETSAGQSPFHCESPWTCPENPARGPIALVGSGPQVLELASSNALCSFGARELLASTTCRRVFVKWAP